MRDALEDVKVALDDVVADINRHQPGAVVVTPVHLIYSTLPGRTNHCVVQLGSLEDNIDITARYLRDRLQQLKPGTPDYRRAVKWEDRVTSASTWLRLSPGARKFYENFDDYHRSFMRPLLRHRFAAAVGRKIASVFRYPIRAFTPN